MKLSESVEFVVQKERQGCIGAGVLVGYFKNRY
jgi:hypothetical protein